MLLCYSRNQLENINQLDIVLEKARILFIINEGESFYSETVSPGEAFAFRVIEHPEEELIKVNNDQTWSREVPPGPEGDEILWELVEFHTVFHIDPDSFTFLVEQAEDAQEIPAPHGDNQDNN